MPTSYPRKQTLLIFVICAAAVVAAALYVRAKTPVSSSSSVEPVVETMPTPIDTATTTANNEWRQQFFVSNTPTDTKSAATVRSKTIAEAPTATEFLGRSFISKYLELKNTGLDKNEQVVNNLIEKSIDNAVSATQKPLQYSETDIRVAATENKDSIHLYGNQVGAVMRNFPLDNPLTIAQNSFDKGDTKLLSELDPILAAYKFMTATLLTVSVPESAIDYHLELVNSMSTLTFITESLRNNGADPTKALMALSIYRPTSENLVQALRDLRMFLETEGIHYAKTETGSRLTGER